MAMKDVFKGKAYVLGDNIDTDQIIPASHLVYRLDDPEERKKYGQYALSGVPDKSAGLPDGGKPFVKDGGWQSEFNIIVGGKNFGCGSSREHAPEALKIAGVEAIVAEFYARIFYRNSVDGGFFVPFECEKRLCDTIKTGEEIEIQTKEGLLKNLTTGKTCKLKSLGDVEDILRAGNVFEYARRAGMMKK